MIDDTQPNSVDPNGETRPFLPQNDNGVDPNGATMPYLPGEEPADPFNLPPVQPYQYAAPAQPYPYDPNLAPAPEGYTQPYIPSDPLSTYQPVRLPTPQAVVKHPSPARQNTRSRRRFGCNPGCGCGCFTPLLLVLLALLVYFLAPLRTNLLVLGLDRAPEGTALGRTDTMILVSVNPLMPTIKMLSIPRDLWINIPGVGENRINTVHFFAEGNQPGSGPATTLQVVRDTFNVPVSYYARVRFDAVVGIVDAMGGVDITMPEAMSGYEAGTHHLDGTQALAFARDRKGTDDFFRMAHGQLLIKSIVKQMINPLSWGRVPQITGAFFQMVDTNVPFWQFPRLGVALARGVLFGGLDNRTLDREMATPFVTSGGAQVLLPQWALIQPLIHDMFGG